MLPGNQVCISSDELLSLVSFLNIETVPPKVNAIIMQKQQRLSTVYSRV